MNSDELEIPEINYTVFSGKILRINDLSRTRSGLFVLVFFVENRMRKEHLSEAGEDSAKISVLKVAAWGKLAQTMANRLSKGTTVLVEGKLASLAYENRRREMRYNMEIYASAIQILEAV